MIDNYNPEDFERLKQEVETLVGRSVKTPKDFEFLSRQIEGYTNETISVSTLKRMWGYVASPCKPSKYNLNLLSRMIGYSDWEAFSGLSLIYYNYYSIKLIICQALFYILFLVLPFLLSTK